MIGIYRITNIIDNKCYIGKSLNIEGRINDHKINRRSNKHLQNAIKKYGIENFTFEILEECTKDNYSEREIYWIEYYDSMNNGYNETSGGEFEPGYKWSEEACKRKCGKGNPMYGKHHDSNFKRIISESNRNRTRNSDNIKGDKNPAYGRHWYNNGLENKFLSDEDYENNFKNFGFVRGMIRFKEHNEKISSSLKGKKRNYSSIQGRKLINNGIENKYVYPDEIQSYLDNGWNYGRVKKVIK